MDRYHFPRYFAGFLLAALFVFHFKVSAKPRVEIQSTSDPWPLLLLEFLVDGLQNPVGVESAGDGSGRLFIVEQSGTVRIFHNQAVQSQPFLDISNRVLHSGEQGLLGLAFPPGYSQKGYFYVYYTRKDGNNRVARFWTTSNPDLADPASEELILSLDHPVYSNHNGGQIAFGPDNNLYIGTGDGGGGGDPQDNAQNLSSLLGKILRIDVEAGTSPYAIPPENPFIYTVGARPEIWAYGLRNPWRFSFDLLTGDFYIADVGQGSFEEVNYQPANSKGGENYGWDIFEGNTCYEPQNGCEPPANYVPPVAVYEHGPEESIGCSITGGYVYRAPSQPSLAGTYLYADFCSGRVWGLKREGNSWLSNELLDTPYRVSTFGEDGAGELYLVDYLSGSLFRITAPNLIVRMYLPLISQ